MESRFHSLEIARNKASQIIVRIRIKRRGASIASFFRSVLGHLKEVVGIVFDDDDVYRGTSIRNVQGSIGGLTELNTNFINFSLSLYACGLL